MVEIAIVQSAGTWRTEVELEYTGVRLAVENQLRWCNAARVRTGAIVRTSESNVQVDIVDAATNRLICFVEVANYSRQSGSAVDM